jgi:oxygen-dependent protoporphyrinogen oxidase
MGTLCARLAEEIGVALYLKTSVEHVGLNERGCPVVSFRDHKETMMADAVVVATNVSAVSSLIRTIAPRAAQLVANISSCPLAVVHTAFDKRDVPMKPRGRGYSALRTENVRSLGTLFSSTLFEHRAPSDEVMFTSYVGGAMDAEACDLDDEELANTVRRDLHITMGISEKPTFVAIKRIEKAFPQYAVGHTRRVFEIDQHIDAVPGLFLTGNYLGGTQIPAIADHARRTALKVRAWLRQTKSVKHEAGNTHPVIPTE